MSAVETLRDEGCLRKPFSIIALGRTIGEIIIISLGDFPRDHLLHLLRNLTCQHPSRLVVKPTVRYDHPVRAIRGRVTAAGQVMDAYVWVGVYDNAQVCLDESIPEVEQKEL